MIAVARQEYLADHSCRTVSKKGANPDPKQAGARLLGLQTLSPRELTCQTVRPNTLRLILR